MVSRPLPRAFYHRAWRGRCKTQVPCIRPFDESDLRFDPAASVHFLCGFQEGPHEDNSIRIFRLASSKAAQRLKRHPPPQNSQATPKPNYSLSHRAVKRARHSSGGRISHPATVAPAGSNRSARSGQLLRAKPSVQKVAEKATSERAGHNRSERRASLEKGNVNAELVRNERRPPSLRKASDKSTAEGHRGIGDGMCAKERCVNTGSSLRRGRRAQPEAPRG